MIMLLGGLHKLIATTVEDGGSIGDIAEVAVEPRGDPRPAHSPAPAQ